MNNFQKRDEELNMKNSELDLKTQILLKEIEDVMLLSTEINEDDMEHSQMFGETSTSDCNDAEPSAYPVPQPSYDDSQSLRRRVQTVLEPELKFLRAKIKILSSEMERQRKEYQRKAGEWQTRETEILTLQKDRDKILQQNSALSQQLSKLNTTFLESKEKFQRSEAENIKLNAELQAAKKEMKQSTQKVSTLEIRLNRMIEETETLKAALRNSQLKYRENSEEHRQILEQQISCVQRSERQRNELALAFRRQMLLCHNLQRQKELLIAGAAVKEAEAQFDQLLSAKNAKE